MPEQPADTCVRFLGTASVIPEAGRETASVLINSKILVDAGWCSALKMLEFGVSPADLEYLFLTHCHHDHYLGLPHLLFYRRMQATNTGRDLPPLRIAGPAGDVERIVELARRFLQVERQSLPDHAPEVIPIEAGHAYKAAGLRVIACGTTHAVPSCAYRFDAEESGAAVVISGDTAFNPSIAELAGGATLLIHEAAAADSEPDPTSGTGHSGGAQAARIAELAGVELLALTHGYRKDIERTLAAAKRIFPESVFPLDGETFFVNSNGVR